MARDGLTAKCGGSRSPAHDQQTPCANTIGRPGGRTCGRSSLISAPLERHMKKFACSAVLLGWLLLIPLVPSLARAQAPPAKNHQNSTLCIDCLKIRVGSPIVARGPGPDIEDFSVIQLPDGRFRGFIAGGRTYAVDGKNLWDMGGPRRLVRMTPADNGFIMLNSLAAKSSPGCITRQSATTLLMGSLICQRRWPSRTMMA
jgi:hypothetical protein